MQSRSVKSKHCFLGCSNLNKLLLLFVVFSQVSASQNNGIYELPLTRHKLPTNLALIGRHLEDKERYSSKATLEHDVRNHGNYAYSTMLYIGSHH